jgi:replicative DNA helicase
MNPDSNSHVISGQGLDLAVAGGLESPHSADCERFLIASVLADDTPGAWALASNLGVKSAAFYDSGVGRIWTTVDQLRRAGEPVVDIVVVIESLRAAGVLDDIGGAPTLVRCTDVRIRSQHARFLAETLVLLWQYRYAIKLAAELREVAMSLKGREKFTEIAGGIGQKLIRLGRREASQTLAEIYDGVEAEARARVDNTVDKSRWITSGMPKFDRACKEFGSAREDGYVLLAGGSGDGKSVGLRNIADANLRRGKVVLSFSRETSTAGFIEMLVASRMEIDLNTLEFLPKDKAEQFYAECRRQRDEWADRFLFCVQNTPATPLMTVEDLVSHVRAHVNLRGLPDLVLVDYLQLFGTINKRVGTNRESIVAYASNQLQALQRELDRVMIVALQLNESGLNEMRQVKRDDEGRVIHRMPKAGDLRESQVPYHDADRVIFLYRPPVDCRGNEQVTKGTPTPEVWWYQDKRRRGCAGIFVRCWFQKRFTRFVEMSSEDETEAEKKSVGVHVVPRGQRISKNEFKQGGAR